MAEKLRIVFYGTPEFAVASLEAIRNAGFDLAAIVTSPDRKSGRGMKLTPSAVKSSGVELGIPVLQPTNLKSQIFLDELKTYSPNIQVVIAFRMLPEVVWNLPKLGTINLHASLLPQYRGAAPINWAIINGETETGITTFRLKHEIDTGNILLQETVSIAALDDAGTLHDKLMVEGAKLMVKTLQTIEKGKDTELEQKAAVENKKAPKIFKTHCVIDWNKPVEEIHNLIRGLSPYPAARTSLDGKTLKILKSSIEDSIDSKAAGTIESDNKTYIHIHTANGALKLLDVQLEGKRKMSIDEFLRGFDMNEVTLT
jgi:methionyl-tRNA formyltransferase